MSEYYTEGFVKRITRTFTELTFTLEPTSPYLVAFDKEGGEKKSDRRILFMNEKDDALKGSSEVASLLIKEDVSFQSIVSDYNALLIAKANRMKLRLTVVCDDDKTEKMAQPLIVSKLDVL